MLPLLITLAAAAQPTPALAQTTDEVVFADRRREDIVVTATRSEQLPEEVGQAITVFDAATIERRQARIVTDLLATGPGVTVTRNGGPGGFAGVRIRGADAEQTLVLIDGVRVADPSSPSGGFDFGSLITGNIDRIEVLRGPNAVAWGSQALGGVVNITTVAPTDVTTVDARGEYGARDTVDTAGNVGGAFGPVGVRLGGQYRRSDGISAFDRGTEADGFEQYGATARVDVALSPDVDVDLRGFYTRTRADQDGFRAPTFAFTDTSEYAESRQLNGYAGLNVRAFDDALSNRLAFTIADIDRDTFDPQATPQVTFRARGRTERFEYQGDLRPTDAIRAVFGAEHETTRFRTSSPSSFDPEPTPSSARARITSFYAQAIIQPLAGLTLTGGLRHDDHSRFGGETTAGANLAWKLGNTLLRASYAEGFKAPTLFQLFSDFGNEGLTPERATSFDVGIEQRGLDDRVRASVTYFERRARDQIDFVSCFGVKGGICGGRPFGTYDNVARAEANGVEAELALLPVDGLTVTGSYTHVRAINRSVGTANFGRDLARRPRDTVTTSADWQLGRVGIGSTILVVGDSFDNAANTRRLDGYVLVNLRGSVEITPQIKAFARLDNAFNEDYRTVSNYGTEERGAHVGISFGL